MQCQERAVRLAIEEMSGREFVNALQRIA